MLSKELLVCAAVCFPGEEDGQQIQQSHPQAAIYVQDEQAASVSVQARSLHEGQGEDRTEVAGHVSA